jgi:hypothetical protein
MSPSFLLVRLRPVTPGQPGRRNYTLLKRPGIPSTTKFSEEVGWSKVPAAIAEVLRHEQDHAGQAVFDVLTQQEAVALEYAELERKAKKMVHHKAASPNVMHFQTAKNASDFAADEPASPRRNMKPTPLKSEVVPVVAAEEIDWDSLGSAEPSDDASDEVVTYDAVDPEAVTAEPEGALEAEAPRRKGGRKSK